MIYELYLESGPQHRKTWVFVPGLPGCSTVGPTTEAAVESAAPAAIAERLGFLRRHGQGVEDASIEVVVADHVIERNALGYGQQFFPPDLDPLHPDEVPRLLHWAEWSREEFVAAARALPGPLAVKPQSGRSIMGILMHVAESEWAYVSSTLGTLSGAGAATAAIEKAGDDPWAALAAERATVTARLSRLSPEDLGRVAERKGRPHWTARRMFRRLLEHEWEHTLELQARARGRP